MTDPGEILRALFANPHADLEGYIYDIRGRELLGWEGPSVKSWSDAVVAAKKWLKENPE